MHSSRFERKLDGLFIALALSHAFLALSFLRTIGDAGSAKFGGAVLQSVVAQPIFGTQLGTEIIKFGAALVLVHVSVAVAAWILARVTLSAWPGIKSSQRALTVFWLLLAMVWVLAANAYWYPRTALGGPYYELVSMSVGGLTMFQIVSVIVAMMLVTTLARVIVGKVSSMLRSRLVWAGGAALIAAGVALPAIDGFSNGSTARDDDRPNVILIGIDSLRTDFVQNREHPWTPAVDRFLSEATQFSNAYTPLARTFPAWVSIVTGQHPHTTGAFVNLLPQDQIRMGQTLPSILAAEGYETVYAIDEVRFSNMDLSYGFDKMLAPPMGAADFMLGFFADTPFANILVNSRVGQWLFPYGYANRAMERTYDPDTFLHRIDDGVSFDRPTFLAAHLTLAHWPYTWASAPDPTDPNSASLTKLADNRGLYELAVDRVDRQFDDLMQILEDKHALDNAIVVVLSDHGESLGEASPLTEIDGMTELPLTTSRLIGHGTHVFSKDQYNVVLGFRYFGSSLIKTNQARTLDNAVTLEDLAPTLIDLLGVAAEQRFDGRSLAPYLSADSQFSDSSAERIRFLETEFNPPGISADGMTSVSAILSAAETYTIDPESDRVLIRLENIDDILAKRQYAAELNGDILASVPTASAQQQFLLYFDPEQSVTRWLERAPDDAGDEHLYRLWKALEQRFEPVRNRQVMAPPASVYAAL
jgi:hypothetical protein